MMCAFYKIVEGCNLLQSILFLRRYSLGLLEAIMQGFKFSCHFLNIQGAIDYMHFWFQMILDLLMSIIFITSK